MSTLVLDGETVRPADAPETPRVPWGGLIPEQSYPFTAVHHHDWEFAEDALSPEGEWRPQVSEIRHVPGGNGCYEVGRGPGARINPNPVFAGMESKGSIVIRQDERRLGPYRHYLKRYLLTSGKYFYCYAGVKVVLINRGRAARPRPDPVWMRGFQMQLLQGGLIDPMAPEVLNTHILTIENRINEWDTMRGQGALTEDAFRRMVADAESRIERMRAAWDRQFGGVDHEAVQSAALPEEPDRYAVDAAPEYEDDPPEAPASPTHDKASLVQVAEALERRVGSEYVSTVRQELEMSESTALQRFGVETLRAYIAALRDLT